MGVMEASHGVRLGTPGQADTVGFSVYLSLLKKVDRMGASEAQTAFFALGCTPYVYGTS